MRSSQNEGIVNGKTNKPKASIQKKTNFPIRSTRKLANKIPTDAKRVGLDSANYKILMLALWRAGPSSKTLNHRAPKICPLDRKWPSEQIRGRKGKTQGVK